MMRKLLAAGAIAAPLAAGAQISGSCGGLANGDNGPFDYRTERGPRLTIVEQHHFNARVEALLGGQTGSIEHDLDYVLRAFPNHHRALNAVSRLTIRNNGRSLDPAVDRTADCYFERALRWKADDTIARMLYARYLHERRRDEEAVRQLDEVIVLGADNPFTQYNVGLLFADMGLMDRALQQAHKAQAAGFQRNELMAKLQAAGKWQAPAPPRMPPSAPASSPLPASAPASAGGL